MPGGQTPGGQMPGAPMRGAQMPGGQMHGEPFRAIAGQSVTQVQTPSCSRIWAGVMSAMRPEAARRGTYLSLLGINLAGSVGPNKATV